MPADEMRTFKFIAHYVSYVLVKISTSCAFHGLVISHLVRFHFLNAN